MSETRITLSRAGAIGIVAFSAMASPCEILVASDDEAQVREIGEMAACEARRIETKFSRYRDDSVITRINTSAGRPLTVDPETALLLDFAAQCHVLSEGLFDVTSGVLRRVWKFDGSDRLPEQAAVAALLPLIGFDKVRWRAPEIVLPDGMEIDFGGIGKEYAVDRVMGLLNAEFDVPLLVNFGGDLCTNRSPEGQPWRVGIERPDIADTAARVVEISRGALATSGDTRRFLLRDGRRYSHILNPFTGWPVVAAPRSMTVAAPTCMEAGMLATFSLLQGADACAFLDRQDVPYWCLQ